MFKKIKKPAYVLYRLVENDIIILNAKSNLYYSLDKIGAMIWQLLMQGKTIDEIVDLIKNKYALSKRDKVRQDVGEIFGNFVKEGLVELCKD